MPEAKSYTIDKVGWHTRTPDNTEPWEKTHKRFRIVIDFLQNNGLTSRTILGGNDVVDDETCIHTNDLTEKGILLMKKAYHRWLKKVDKGLDPEDVSIFDKTLGCIMDEE